MGKKSWTGILNVPLTNPDNLLEDLEARDEAIMQYFGITKDVSESEIVRYKLLAHELARKLKIPGYLHNKHYKDACIKEVREFIFWLEFKKLQLEKGYKNISTTADFFKIMQTNSEIIKSYQRKSALTIIDNYKNINKSNALAKELMQDKTNIKNNFIRNYDDLPFKVPQKYRREIYKLTNKTFLEVIEYVLSIYYKHYDYLKSLYCK